METIYSEVQVRIPNLEGDAVAETHVIRVPVSVDPETGEELLTEEAIELIETTKARYLGLLLPEEIKDLRRRLDLTQKQMAELLQAGEKSYTRWESGNARPSRMVNLLLRLLFESKVAVEALRSVGCPRSPGAEVEAGPDEKKSVISKVDDFWPTIKTTLLSYKVLRCWEGFSTPANQPRDGLIKTERPLSDYHLQRNSKQYRLRATQNTDPDEALPTSA
jgi:putative zinc finger/helix-turn-helix YgiT family protein